MGAPKVVVCEDLWKRLRTCKEAFRTLYGCVDTEDNVLYITGSTVQRLAFPYGQPAIGVYATHSASDMHIFVSKTDKRLEYVRMALDALDLPNFVVLTATETGEPSARLIEKYSFSEEKIDCEIADLISFPAVLLRTRLSLPLSIEYTRADGQFYSDVENAIHSCSSWLADPTATFELRGQLMKSQKQLTLQEFLRNAFERKSEPEGLEMLEVNTIRVLSGEAVAAECGYRHVPVIDVHRRSSQRFAFDLHLDIVSLCTYNTRIEHVATQLAAALRQQALFSIETVSCSVIDGCRLVPPRPKHFAAGGPRSFATAIFPANKATAGCKNFLREDLLLPEDRAPFFSPGQALFFVRDSPLYRELLLNPHLQLKNPPKTDQVATVRGNYLYYHYKQQKFEDSGWGCAYRSLQTLCSWFILQGYSDITVPNHRRIQETLVEIGDKEHTFIGSKQWIGSQEVSFVLNQLMNIDCKTICASSGGELATKAQDLISHFKSHGTPVMIGGGQLAHTILGVAVNTETDETFFLVLDPHYTGAEDLHTVNSKGWCNWKPSSFWDKTSFYNMCLPQVPRTVC